VTAWKDTFKCRPSAKLPIFKRIVHYKGIVIWKSPSRFCFVDFLFFCSVAIEDFNYCFFVKIKLNRIKINVFTIQFYLSKNIWFHNKIRFKFD
jgi:hypothetical protein